MRKKKALVNLEQKEAAMPSKKGTGRPPGRPTVIGGPVIQPRVTPEDDKRLGELAVLPAFEGNRSQVVRVAIRELYERRIGKMEERS
ncbi:hypothetical protein [Polyangium mundeleinium]|uniref:CopG family transcriptional regulator n=1 Tax=Polyangium mundeleinium TaxID=2995306 RepID=A0ABT5F8M2_9BACT|nr:hypothetical protein [Polyangium mundeleinium]MDC0749954.1 hypothetical protein [Polyangium mundeleinium]